MEIRGDEERVVVEHLLEVRDEPAVVDGVAVEAAPDEVVHAAEAIPSSVRSTISGSPRRSRSSSAECGGNFGARPKPPHSGSNDARSPRTASPSSDSVSGSTKEAGGPHGRSPRRARSRSAHVAAALAVRTRYRLEHLAEARQAVAGLGREVRSAVERLAVGRQEGGHRPAAGPVIQTTASM